MAELARAEKARAIKKQVTESAEFHKWYDRLNGIEYH